MSLDRRLHAWAPGTRDVAVRIPLTVVSGRRIKPRPGGAWALPVRAAEVADTADR